MPSSKFLAKLSLLAVAGFGLVSPLAAVSTDTAVQVTYDHFEDGKLENISIPSDGGLRLAPAIEKIAKLDAAVIWKAVADADGNLYVGTGNDGKVFKVTPDGTVTTLFEPGESLARALAVDAKGNVYVGTSPDGYVYRIAPGGRPEIYFHSDDTYIWDLKFDTKGNLYVATGAKGRVYRLPPDYQSTQTPEVYFETDRTHVTTLAFDSTGALLAGAGPKSVLYRITDKNKATVLASPGGDEINGIVAQPDGSIYFSTFNKSAASSASASHASSPPASPGGPPPSPSAGGAGDPSASPPDDDGSGDDAGGAPGGDSSPGGPASPSPASGPKYSQLYRVNPSGFVEPVWSLAHTGVYSFRALPNGRWLIGSDAHGRIFDAAAPQDWNLLQEVPDSSEVSVLLPDPKDAAATLVFSSNPAQIHRLGAKAAASGTYTCAPFDADQPAQWGTLRTLAVPPMPGSPLAGAKWESRTGNTPTADATWTDWQPIADTTDIASPPGRFFQYRVTLTDPAVTVRRLAVYFQHFNAAPIVDRLGVLPVGVDVSTASPPRPPVDLRTILEGDPSALESPPARPQIRSTGAAGAFSVAWHAADPNGDTLVYTVNLRAVGDPKWVTLADDLAQPVFSFSSRGFADGYYQVQVIASDKLNNPPGQARTGERTSTPFLINNTGPAVTLDTQTGDATRYTITYHAHSATTVLDHAQYTLDGQPPKPALPDGNLFDKPDHVFHLQLDHLTSGSHSVLFEVVDEAGNSGSAKTTFDVP